MICCLVGLDLSVKPTPFMVEDEYLESTIAQAFIASKKSSTGVYTNKYGHINKFPRT